MGVDKYSDVLDGEVAGYDFTEAYIRSIGEPQSIENNLYPIENEMKLQMENAKTYKEIIKEDKDLTKLIDKGSDFDVESALRIMLTYYERWQGRDLSLADRIGINDEEIIKLLRTNILHDKNSSLISVSIEDFPNEPGYFMLWELSISDDESGKHIIPIFVNENYLFRPMAGKRLLDVFLDVNSVITVGTAPNISGNDYERFEKLSMDFAYESFMELKDKQLKQNQEAYNKYIYALKLRKDAAEHIGIENIKKSRLEKLKLEKNTIEANYKKGSQVYPDFKLMILLRLEA